MRSEAAHEGARGFYKGRLQWNDSVFLGHFHRKKEEFRNYSNIECNDINCKG